MSLCVKDSPATQIGPVKISGKVGLAPLAGATDIPFRLICKEMGASVVFSEMVSSEGLVRGSERTNRYLKFLQDERPIALQLFGGDPEVMGRAARIVEENYMPDIIDINFGCPVKKVVKNIAGSALLKFPRRMGRIVKSMVKTVNTPVTAKIRCGWDENSSPVSEIGKILEGSGISAISIHARTRNQQFTGRADWSEIRKLKEAVSVPVIGNGDVRSPQDAQRMFEETGCDMVMIGRGAMGNPWIFREIDHFFTAGVLLPPPSDADRMSVCMKHLQTGVSMYGERYAITRMKKHIGWYLKGLPGSGSVKQRMFNSQSCREIFDIVYDYIHYLTRYSSGLISLTEDRANVPVS
ncbi:tRNA dihydrouridine synthase DusB [candidate division KSB1 bacterium]